MGLSDNTRINTEDSSYDNRLLKEDVCVCRPFYLVNALRG